MALTDLIAAYIYPTTAITQAQQDGDAVAEARMLAEIAEAIETELVPAAQDRQLTRAQNNNLVRAWSQFYPNAAQIGTIYGPGGPATIQITQRQYQHIKQLAGLAQNYRSEQRRLEGRFPTADGVLDPTKAIYPGTKVWTVHETDTPGTYAVFREPVVEDDGDNNITVLTDDGNLSLPRHRVHYEFTDAEVDQVTAAYVDDLTVGDTLTDGVDSWDITGIDHDAREITLDNLTPSGLVLTFEDAFADWTKV